MQLDPDPRPLRPAPGGNGPTDPARAIRTTLLDDARALAARQRLLCCIPFKYQPARLRYLLAAVRSLGELAVGAFDLRILTDAEGAGEHDLVARLCRPMLPRGSLTVHAFAGLADPRHLPWCHKRFVSEVFLAPDSPYDLFLYLEDDLLFGMNNLVYWLAARRALAPFGLIPSFVRYEYNDRDQHLYATDICFPAAIETKQPLTFGDWMFIQPDFPYDATYLLDRALALRHRDAPAFDLEQSREVVDLGDLERAACGPRYDGRPAGCGTWSTIALDARTLIPVQDCCIHHLPDNYVHGPGPHAQLRLDRVYYREAANPSVADDAPPPPAAFRIDRGSLREAIAARDPGQEAHGIAFVRTVVPAGCYRRAPPLLIDTSGLSSAAREVCTRGLGRCAQDYESVFLAGLNEARLFGSGSVATAGGLLVEESCWEFFAQGLPLPGAARNPDGSLLLPEHPHRIVEGPALLVKRPFLGNYGHWLLDAAIPLALAAAQGLAEGMPIIVGTDEGASPEQQAVIDDTLRLLAPDAPVLQHPDGELWRIGMLHYLSPVGTTPLFRLPEGIAALRARLLADLPPTPRRRLFVSRGAQPRRQLTNEAELFALCAAFGFERVVPEEHSLAEQAAMFHTAEAIVGVKGAALTNVLFCRPGTPLIVLSPDEWWEPLFWDLASQVGCPYLEVFGPVTHRALPVSHNPFRIAPVALRRALRTALPPPVAFAWEPPPAIPPARGAVVAAPPPPTGTAIRLPEHAGEFYQSVLGRLHAALAPRRYLEIGSLEGDTLRLARGATIAIDPDFRLERDVAARLPLLLLFPLTSDAFFRRHDPAALLGGPLDLVFIDGMHHVEVALRDFINVERHANAGTLVVLHDCVPLDLAMAGRDAADSRMRATSVHPEWWTGDVWKLLGVLRRHRPDLDIQVFDAPPTGLVVIRGLDPTSQVLSDRYAAIVTAVLGEADDAGAFARHVAALDLRPTAALHQALATPGHSVVAPPA